MILTSVSTLLLTLREAWTDGALWLPALIGLVTSACMVGASRSALSLRALGVILFVAQLSLITLGALAGGGTAGSVLIFSFIPGFMATFALGAYWGWAVCAAMLACMAWLVMMAGLPLFEDRLRYVDHVALALLATASAHALSRSFDAHEAVMVKRERELLQLSTERRRLSVAIYEQLEPLVARFVVTLSAPALDWDEARRLVRRLRESLSEAKSLFRSAVPDAVEAPDPSAEIRVATMRVWLWLGAGFMVALATRNAWLGVAFVPALCSLGFCFAFLLWLRAPAAKRYLELTALALGVCATGPLVAHLYTAGALISAPAVVLTPGPVLFTALLSRGPASWAVAAVNAGVLGWVASTERLSLVQSQRLVDLGICFVMVILALGTVFELRARFARELLAQGEALAEALRQHRRVAGTLFHDVSNHVQTLLFELEVPTQEEEMLQNRLLARRVQHLIEMAKDWLLNPRPRQVGELETVRVGDAVALLREVFGLRVTAKSVRLDLLEGAGLSVRAQPELLIDSVLGNLIGNAIKFSPPGGVIEVRAVSAGGYVRIAVSDRGPGLPLPWIDQLGQDGALRSEPGSMGEPGQGFGLQLAREHVARMGGRLELKQRSGGGTDAVVWLEAG